MSLLEGSILTAHSNGNTFWGQPAIAGVTSSAGPTGCDNAVTRFNGTSTTNIKNAPLRALDVTQATSPLLADDCLTTNLNLALIPKGTGALIASIPGSVGPGGSGGNARGTRAVDLQMQRIGVSQVASASFATISGGQSNTANATSSTVGGGGGNVAGGLTGAGYATVRGGFSNVASGGYATVPGGISNVASGNYSFAAGLKASASAIGTFTWADAVADGNLNTQFNNIVIAQFRVRARGGVQFITTLDETGGLALAPGGSSWGTPSDRNLKENFVDIDTEDILNKLVNIQIQSWNYKSQDPSIRHIGPMAQDYNPTFGFSEIPLAITTLDFDGVALAAIQGLHKLHEAKIQRLEALIQQLITQNNLRI